MFQTFDAGPDPSTAAPRIAALRDRLKANNIEAYLVPRADEHQNEYVPPSAERLKWLTGFSGSAGLAVVARRKAAVFVDGRYTVQVRAESDAGLFDFPGIAGSHLVEWLTRTLPAGATIAYDPSLHSVAETERLTAELKRREFTLKPLRRNLVDQVWGQDRPMPPQGPVVVHDHAYTGRDAKLKVADVQEVLAKAGHDAVVLTLPDSICWLFNIRGCDVAHNPVVLAFAIVPQKGKPELFVDPAKLSKEARAHLQPVAKLSPPDKLNERLASLSKSGKTVRLDDRSAAFELGRKLGLKKIARASDPCLHLKAVKNSTEISGARAAHARDGAALARFLAWLDRSAPEGSVDEIAAVRRLEETRAATQQLKEISFDTISGSGPNGAIVHYRVSEKTNRRLRTGELFLLDSGAQYLDGTTDITRTIAIGMPTAEMRERFTLVLKGNIAIGTARFPNGTRGIDLDPFARRALWECGLDYGHGTGHGVGSYLSVHEGPQSISRAGMVALEPGMICSNEPGYYKQGAYGIRIENLVLVTPPDKVSGGDLETMGFETLTLCPIDRRLIVRDMLSASERAWLDAYHARVMSELGPQVDAETRDWLAAATARL